MKRGWIVRRELVIAGDRRGITYWLWGLLWMAGLVEVLIAS